MAAGIRGVTSGDSGSSTGGSFNATFHASAVAGDVAVLAVAQNGTQSISGLSGWTIDPNTPVTVSGNNNRLTVYTKELTSGDISAGLVAVTFGGAQRYAWAVVVVQDTAGPDVSDDNQSNTQVSTAVLPSVDPTDTNALWLGFIVGRNSTNGTQVTWTAPSGHTEQVDRTTTNAGSPNTNLLVTSKALTADTATGTATATPSANVAYCSLSIVLAADVVDQTVNPSGIQEEVEFGTPTVMQDQTVAPGGIAETIALGTPTVIIDQFVEPDGVAQAVTFGTPTVTLAQTVEPDGIDQAVAFGTPAVTIAQTIAPSGFTVPIGVGTPAVEYPQDIEPGGVAQAVTLGTPTVIVERFVEPQGIAQAVAFGTPVVLNRTVVAPSGFAEPVTFGTPRITKQQIPDLDVTLGPAESGWSLDVAESGWTLAPAGA